MSYLLVRSLGVGRDFWNGGQWKLEANQGVFWCFETTSCWTLLRWRKVLYQSPVNSKVVRIILFGCLQEFMTLF